ncbi:MULTISPECIES: uracil-DNA glycosylase family protein [unclassified Microbacterium]|uniref:uracil-DNA glycosylase family protein n=1 Tax=unclassified Microbacterium TaxID=2609290 RepID=UPI0025FD975F|nr:MULTISPECIES: uracil-DNA glycosylase family protein [unclassified Microbacterium]
MSERPSDFIAATGLRRVVAGSADVEIEELIVAGLAVRCIVTTSDGPLVGFQERAVWMGDPILTLADLWPDKTRAMIVGLNPASKSVEIGHYYQGTSGRRQLLRLANAGLFQMPAQGTFFEEAALTAGVGFTDLVKRPTRGEGDLAPAELARGRASLMDALRAREVPLVVCVFRQPADAVMGTKSTVGFQATPTPWGGKLFRMPGPFDRADRVDSQMQALKDALRSAQ